MEYRFAFSVEKSAWLKIERGIGFEEIIALIESGALLSVFDHPNQRKYPGQFICEVDAGGYVYVVPCLIEGAEIFFKTIYPSRKATRKYRKEGSNDEKN